MVQLRNSYSQEFKDAVVTKIMNRGDSTVAEVCAKEGIRQSSAYRWMTCDTVPAMKNKAKAKKWTAKEKLQAVNETAGLDESEIGIYLRKVGLHSQQLDEWRSQILASLEPARSGKDERDERIRQLEGDVRRVESEVRRKDKALAEASALLILQKKANLIWGDGDPK